MNRRNGDDNENYEERSDSICRGRSGVYFPNCLAVEWPLSGAATVGLKDHKSPSSHCVLTAKIFRVTKVPSMTTTIEMFSTTLLAERIRL